MNISPGPRIIIRNEIAPESLISHRAADAVALGMCERRIPKATTAIFRAANHRPSEYDERWLCLESEILFARAFLLYTRYQLKVLYS